MHIPIGQRRKVANNYTPTFGTIHKLLPKLHHNNNKKNVIVQDLSESLIPIIGTVKFAVVIHNLFTVQECRDLINITEERHGYDNALVHGPNGIEILRRDIRNSGRCIIDDEEMARDWFDRMVQALDEGGNSGNSVVKDRLFDAHWLMRHGDQSKNKKKSLQVVGLNERLRFLRYHPGQYFGIHRDNAFTRDTNNNLSPSRSSAVGEESHLTFLLYLNDKMEGGQTRIHGDGRYLDIAPETGSVLIFDHDVLHEAVRIESGTKYCCRTDVMFEVKEETVEQQQEGVVKKLLLPSENVWASRVKSVGSIR